MMDNGSVKGISNVKMVFPDTVVKTYSEPYPKIEDGATLATWGVAALVQAKFSSPNDTGLNGVTTPDTDYLSNPYIGCYAYNMRGEDGSSVEFFG